MDTEEIDLLTGSLREVLAGAAADVPGRLRELGWDDVAAADPAAATTLLFTEKGRALSAAALLDDALLPLLSAELPASLGGGAASSATPIPAQAPGRHRLRLARPGSCSGGRKRTSAC